MNQYIFDVETLSTSETAVILSAAAIKVDFTKELDYYDLVRSAFYVKFDAKEQITKYNRTVDKNTVNWWKTVPQEIQDSQAKPSKNDVPLASGMKSLCNWFIENGFDKRDSVVWTRGDLDNTVIQHISKQLEIEPPFSVWRVRDIRTAVDILSGSNNGYAKLSKPLPATTKKHDPVHDCAMDAFQLKYYIES